MSSVAARLVAKPVARPTQVAARKPARTARSVLVRGAPSEKAIRQAIQEAEEACAGGAGGEW